MNGRWKLPRDTVLFFAGLAGIAHETLIWDGPERPTLLLLFAAFLGLPVFLRTDERRRDRAEDEGTET